jgi:hypothetical protein
LFVGLFVCLDKIAEKSKSVLLITESSPALKISGCKRTSIEKVPWLLVRKRTIPTERPPVVGEGNANFCR